MASSISSSEEILLDTKQALPAGLRLTASDRPGMAQPVPERDVPEQPWHAMSLAVLILLVLFTSLWEWKMRTLELFPGDLGASYDRWAELRHQVDQRDVPVVIVGDSRIMFDTDLDHAAQLIGVRPLQLAIAGGSGLPILEDIADDPHFHGLVIVGMAETAYFDLQLTGARPQQALTLSRWESPAKRGSFLIHRLLSQGLAMLDDDYQLSTLVFRLDRNWRSGVVDMSQAVWKAQETGPDGQTWLWRRLEHDRRLSDHMRNAWLHFYRPEPLDGQAINDVMVKTKLAVDKIRARGGDVVFVRPPSAPYLRAIEDKHISRARAWDPLLAYTHSKGVHIDDLPAAQNLTLPEGSHLSRACACVFSDAYLRALAGKSPLLHLQPGAPPVLNTSDCVATSITGSKAGSN
jgi:hypothetical protein